MQSRLSKNPNLPYLLLIGKNMHSLRSRFQNSNVESVDELENVCPNLSLTVENEIGNSHKRGWSHFKLNIND